MASRKKYWPTSIAAHHFGCQMECRASFVWDLLKHALYTGTRGKEDSAGRAALELLPPREIIDRAYAIVDLFVAEAETRGELREFTESDLESTFKRGGELQRIKNVAEYPRTARVEVRD